jgi:ABC-type multidrug transport system ATPase subunit
MIKLQGLTCRFNGLTAVDNLTFEVKEGEIFGLVGPNGGGKITTARAATFRREEILTKWK